MNRLLSLLSGLLVVLYPLAIYLGLSYWEPASIGLILIVLFSLRLLLAKHAGRFTTTPWIAAIGVAIALLSLVANSEFPFRFYPVAVNGVLLGLFGLSLFRGPSFVERIARMTEPDLPEQGVHYTRRVTQLWCLFFIINGSAALYTALYASLELWTIYNGLIAYVLMGVLVCSEWVYRRVFIEDKK
ncbi:hypothetical protein [Aestuariirhabdus sp. LZHN29]|uniref:COG4648 family protein n=1 Tax=Aestuariirhabdus sp. LZHN29 TaxID=3417462 RepID=UPI003CF1828D